jgi:hypothetical protein
LRAASLKKSAWCQACLIDLGDFKKGIAADEIEDLSKELKKEVPNPNPIKPRRRFSSMGERSSVRSRRQTSCASPTSS